ncbi:MAG: hypothetical protein WDN26_14675 [Chitinophagaceae bacterium]
MFFFNVYHKEDPCVSVIMATYNRSSYLHRSIASFINQTYKAASSSWWTMGARMTRSM